MSTDESQPLHEWDAAYVLGALSPEDRRRFEAHLEECPECRASVRELAGLPALLSRVPAPSVDAGGLGDAAPPAGRLGAAAPPAGRLGEAEWRPEPPSTLLPALAHRVRRRRVGRRWALGGASVLVAAAIAAAVVLPTSLAAPPSAGTQVALAQTTPSPLSATVSLTARKWGTELAMTCRYDAPPGAYATTRSYALYVTDTSGAATRVSSWSAWPGAEIRASGAVDLQKSRLRSVEVRDTATDAVLLSAPVK